MANGTVIKTGAVTVGTPLVASAAAKQIRVEKITVSVGTVEAAKLLKFSEEGGAATPFFIVPLHVAGVYVFEPKLPFALAIDKDLDLTDDATGSAVEYAIFVEYHIDDRTAP